MSVDLEYSIQSFIRSTNFTPFFGIELEFYLFYNDSLSPLLKNDIKNFIIEFRDFFENKSDLLYHIEEEQGVSQIEIKTDFTNNLSDLCNFVNEIKLALYKFAKLKQYNISFDAQPLDHDCGSSLQFNISLHDINSRKNCLSNQLIIDKFCYNLLNKTSNFFFDLISSQNDLKRFDLETNIKLFKKGKYMAPINLSYGFDNRSCAIRIANSKIINQKRIEYRIACANCNPALIISHILTHSLEFLDYQLPKINKYLIYGNSFDYDLELLSAFIPGNSIPSNHSKKAPPAVDI